MATENFLNGSDFLLFIDTTTPITTPLNQVDLEDFELVACLKSNGFEGSTGSIDTSTKCSGLDADSIPGERSWTMSGEGNSINLATGDARKNHQKLLKLWRQSAIFWAATFDAQKKTLLYGVVYFSAFSLSAPKSDALTFSFTLTGKAGIGDQDDYLQGA